MERQELEKKIEGTRYYDLTRMCPQLFPGNYDWGNVYAFLSGKKVDPSGMPVVFSAKDVINASAVLMAGDELGLIPAVIIEDLERLVRKMLVSESLEYTVVYETFMPEDSAPYYN